MRCIVGFASVRLQIALREVRAKGIVSVECPETVALVLMVGPCPWKWKVIAGLKWVGGCVDKSRSLFPRLCVMNQRKEGKAKMRLGKERR